MQTIFTALVIAVTVLALGSGIASAADLADAAVVLEGCNYGYGH